MATAAGHLGGDDGGAGAREGLVDGLAGRGVVLDRALHALDRLLGAVAALGLAVRDLPHRRLLAVARPVAPAALPHRIPAGLMLPVIVAAADDQAGLVPDDLRAHRKAGSFQALRHRCRMERPMPDVDDIARKQRPGLAPVGAVIVEDPAGGELLRLAELPAPGRVVVHAIWRIAGAQMRPDAVEHPF